MISFAVKNCVSSTNKNKNELVQRQSLILLMTIVYRIRCGDVKWVILLLNFVQCYLKCLIPVFSIVLTLYIVHILQMT